MQCDPHQSRVIGVGDLGVEVALGGTGSGPTSARPAQDEPEHDRECGAGDRSGHVHPVLGEVGADEIRTTCSKYDSGTNYVPTADCPGSIPQSGTGPEITCNTATTLGTPVTACQVGDVMPTATLDTIAACHPTVTTPLADFAGVCTDGPTGVPGEVVRCARRMPSAGANRGPPARECRARWQMIRTGPSAVWRKPARIAERRRPRPPSGAVTATTTSIYPRFGRR